MTASKSKSTSRGKSVKKLPLIVRSFEPATQEELQRVGENLQLEIKRLDTKIDHVGEALSAKIGHVDSKLSSGIRGLRTFLIVSISITSVLGTIGMTLMGIILSHLLK